MFSSFLNIAVKLLIVLAFGLGLWLFFGEDINRHTRERLRKKKLFRPPGKRKAALLIQHLERLLSTVLKRPVKQEPYLFLYGSTAMFVISFSLLFSLGSVRSLAFSVMAALFPYLVLRVQLSRSRITGSYDGVAVVTTLNNNYKQKDLNMLQALEETACSESLSFDSRKHLLTLVLALRTYRDENELNAAVDTFVYAYETEWAILLGLNIKTAIHDGSNVCGSLEDILSELKSVGELLEINKRFNSESYTMIKFMLLPLYFFTVYLCKDFFGFSMAKFFQYQFVNPVGLGFACMTFAGMAVCYLILLLQKPKFDF